MTGEDEGLTDIKSARRGMPIGRTSRLRDNGLRHAK
jgi:hypothetical protein